MKKYIILSLLSLSQIALAQTTNDIFNEFAKLKKSQTPDAEYINLVSSKISDFFPTIPNDFDKKVSQYFIVVDSSVKKQNLFIAFWDSNKQQVILSSNMTKVSTGSYGSFQHFITPTGWVEQLPSNGTYRAEGTKNENGIRGYGVKGMRVWDFGWKNAYTGWLKNPDLRQIRMQMHATDPDYLESRLGNPASKGCVRISAETNKFLDNFGIIDKKIEGTSQSWTLKKDRTPVPEEGSFLLVVNTEEKN